MSTRSSATLLALSALAAAPLLVSALSEPRLDPDWQEGAVELQSAGSLAFGPDGVLFIADHEGAAIVAMKLHGKARAAAGAFEDLEVESLDEVLSFLLDTTRDDVTINDLAVDPTTGAAYLSVTRGGEKGQAVLVAVHGKDDFEVLDLEDVPHLRVSLDNAPSPDDGGRRSRRTQSITDLAYHDGVLYVAGLSNEEFASKLRALDFPFAEAEQGASIEIYHGAHGAWETRAPVRTMTPVDLDGESTLLCGYTCTPLVRVPIKQIEGTEKFVGTTVAELGAGNVPLDMIRYEKSGTEHLLIANSRRGVMKLETKGLESIEGLTERVQGETAGQPYETIEELKDISQLAGLDATRALVIVENDEGAVLKTIELP